MMGSQVLAFTVALGLATLLGAYAVAVRRTATARLTKAVVRRRVSCILSAL
jgi:hypothetical protein